MNKVVPFPQRSRPSVRGNSASEDGRYQGLAACRLVGGSLAPLPSVGRVAPAETVASYVIGEEIACGGMASVHLGLSIGSWGVRRPVAMKRIRSGLANAADLQAALRNEALLGCHIRHPNVVPVLDLVEADGVPFLVMEHIVGETLSSLLKSDSPPPLNVSIAIMSGVLRGLHAAHTATDGVGQKLNLIHRDVSPQNILIGSDGIARIIDFGLAKTHSSEATCIGLIKGKIGYFAPEQFFQEPLDARTDVFAAGIVLWEALAGRRLFRRDDPLEDVARLATHRLRPVSNFNPLVGQQLDAVLACALRPSREQRFDTAEQFAEALEGAVRPSTPSEVARYLESQVGDAIETQRLRLRQFMQREEHAGSMRAAADPKKNAKRQLYASDDDVTVVQRGLSDLLETQLASDFEATAMLRPPRATPPLQRNAVPKAKDRDAARALPRPVSAQGHPAHSETRAKAPPPISKAIPHRESHGQARPRVLPHVFAVAETTAPSERRTPRATPSRARWMLAGAAVLLLVGLGFTAVFGSHFPLVLTARALGAWSWVASLAPALASKTSALFPAGQVLPSASPAVCSGAVQTAVATPVVSATPSAQTPSERAPSASPEVPQQILPKVVAKTQAKPSHAYSVRDSGARHRAACEMPYRYDSTGVKRMKPQCL